MQNSVTQIADFIIFEMCTQVLTPVLTVHICKCIFCHVCGSSSQVLRGLIFFQRDFDFRVVWIGGWGGGEDLI